jgi:hypothetical protein
VLEYSIWCINGKCVLSDKPTVSPITDVGFSTQDGLKVLEADGSAHVAHLVECQLSAWRCLDGVSEIAPERTCVSNRHGQRRLYGLSFSTMRTLIDEALTIDWAAPAVRQALSCGTSKTGVLSWHSGDLEVASIGFAWNAASRVLVLRYTVDGAERMQRIQVVHTTPRFGGTRGWFWCVTGHRRTRSLVLPAGAAVWVARSIAPLSYSSQRTRTAWLRALGVDGRRERARLQRNGVRRLRRRERLGASRA